MKHEVCTTLKTSYTPSQKQGVIEHYNTIHDPSDFVWTGATNDNEDGGTNDNVGSNDKNNSQDNNTIKELFSKNP